MMPIVLACAAALLVGALLAWLLTRAHARAQLAVQLTHGEHLLGQVAELQTRLQQRENDIGVHQRAAGDQQARVAELQTQLAQERHQNLERLASFEGLNVERLDWGKLK